MKRDVVQNINIPGGKEQPSGQKEGHPVLRELISYIKIIVVACVFAFFVSHFVLINAQIPSRSMEDLLTVKDRIFGCRLSYAFQGPDRFDVVMFRYPVNEEKIYIKRVIGLPGETVKIREGGIYIDGEKEPLQEDYLPEEWVDGNDGFVFHVPEESYLMLGDNRNISEDARYWARCALQEGVASTEEEAQKYTYVHADKIIGQAVLKYYPKIELL